MSGGDSHEALGPSAWVQRFSPLVVVGGQVLDVAAGAGRHSRLFLDRRHRVVAVDIDPSRLRDLAGLRVVAADLERAQWPFADGVFAGVVVTNYLWRPLLPHLRSCLEPGGVLLYETFAVGNERFGRPRNPDFLLRPGELLDAFAPGMRVVAAEQVEISQPKPAVVQRICAVREATARPLTP